MTEIDDWLEDDDYDMNNSSNVSKAEEIRKTLENNEI